MGNVRTILLRAVLALLVVAWAAFIFTQSEKPGPESDAVSRRVVEQIVALIPGVERSGEACPSFLNGVVRKTAHFAEFAMLGALSGCFAQTFFGPSAAGKWERRRFLGALLALGFCIVYAGTDELHQAFVPGRGPMGIDVLIDSAGAAIGVLLIWAAFAGGDRWRTKRPRTGQR